MAESPSTSQGEAGASRTQTLVSLEESDESQESTSPPAEDVEALRKERDELKALNERHRQQMRGWEEQSRRNLDDRNALAERLARLEGRVEATHEDRTNATQILHDASQEVLDDLNAGLDAWAKDDKSGLTKVVNAVKRLMPQTQQSTGLTPEQVRQIFHEGFQEQRTQQGLIAGVARKHPELNDHTHPLTRAVFEEYDKFVADADNQALYPKDARYEFTWQTPQGAKIVDVRMMNGVATELRAAMGYARGRREAAEDAEVGTAQTRGSRGNRRAVEAIELMQGEVNEVLNNPAIGKGWDDLPTEPKQLAKFLWDGLSATEKQRRLSEYRAKNERVGGRT